MLLVSSSAEYVHGRLSRRDFLDRAGKFAVAGAAAESVLLALSPNFAAAQQVAPSDARLEASYVEYPSPEGYGTLRGYLVRLSVELQVALEKVLPRLRAMFG